MKIPRRDALKTRENLLAAASIIFAEKGYRDTTIFEICNQANSNIAAINYHFGNKETLYKETWRHSFSESIKTHPPDGGIGDSRPPDERLRGSVNALLHRIADENNKEFLIVQKELANPTGLLEEVMREELQPLHDIMESLVRELLGSQASDMHVRFCTISIISQCINPIVAAKAQKKKWDDKGALVEIKDIEAYSNHVVKFSLAGINSIRKELEKKQQKRANTVKRCDL